MLKDRDRTRPRRLVLLGKIRLGHKEKKRRRRRDGTMYEVEYPVQDDHFVLTDAPEIASLYGDTPREIDVILPFPEPTRNFDAAYTVWAGGVLCCKGDGEFVEYAGPFRVEDKRNRTAVYNTEGATLVNNGAAQAAFDWNGQHFEPGDLVPCPGAAQDLYPHCRACRMSAVLKVMMARPELFRLGYYRLATGSGRNYDTICGTLELIYEQAARVSGIPFKLRLVEEPTTYEENGKRHQTMKWFVQLEPDPGFTRRLYRKKAMAVLGEQDEGRVVLPEPEEIEGQLLDLGPEEVPPPFAEDGGPATEPEPEEEAQEEPAAPAAAKGNGKMTRPLTPAQVKTAIERKVARAKHSQKTGFAGPSQRGLVISKLEEAIGPVDGAGGQREAVLAWLLDKGGAAEATMAEAGALLDWLLDPKGRKDGTYDLHPKAPAEVEAILDLAMADEEQDELPFEDAAE